MPDASGYAIECTEREEVKSTKVEMDDLKREHLFKDKRRRYAQKPPTTWQRYLTLSA